LRETNLTGYSLGIFHVGEFVGEGGMSEVYRAHDPGLQMDRALKILKPSLARSLSHRDRFLNEAREAAQLEHHNIVQIYGVGEAHGYYFIAMQFLSGSELEDLIEQRGPLPPSEVVSIIGQVASALDHAHARGRIHRDVKPSNIFVRPDGHVTIIDFGLVRNLEETDFTQTETMGTPAYMSPEHIKGTDIGPASDVYSLGHVIFRALTGRVAFEGEYHTVIWKQMREKPPSMRGFNPTLTGGMDRVIRKALAKQPSARWPRAGALARALEEAVEGPGTLWSKIVRILREGARPVMAALLVVALVIAAVVFAGEFRDEPGPATRTAEAVAARRTDNAATASAMAAANQTREAEGTATTTAMASSRTAVARTLTAEAQQTEAAHTLTAEAQQTRAVQTLTAEAPQTRAVQTLTAEARQTRAKAARLTAEANAAATATAAKLTAEAEMACPVVDFYPEKARLGPGDICTNVVWRLKSGNASNFRLSRLGFGETSVGPVGKEEACFNTATETRMEFKLFYDSRCGPKEKYVAITGR